MTTEEGKAFEMDLFDASQPTKEALDRREAIRKVEAELQRLSAPLQGRVDVPNWYWSQITKLQDLLVKLRS